MKSIHVFAAIMVLFFALIGAATGALMAATGFTAWRAAHSAYMWPQWVYAMLGGFAGAMLSLKMTAKKVLWIRIAIAMAMAAAFAALSWFSIEYDVRSWFVTSSVWQAALMSGCTTGLIGLVSVTYVFWGKGDKEKS